jgi:hypothetical protein
MRKLVLGALFAAFGTVGAQADWKVDDESDRSGVFIVAYSVDATDTVELQVICDEAYDGQLVISFFTGDFSADAGKRPSPVDFAVRFGATELGEPMTGNFFDADGELIIDIYEDDEPGMRDIVAAMAKGKPMTISYRDKSWAFANRHAGRALATVTEGCPA